MCVACSSLIGLPSIPYITSTVPRRTPRPIHVTSGSVSRTRSRSLAGNALEICYQMEGYMKRSVVWILLSSVLVLTAVPVHAQETEPERKSLVVEPGNALRATLEKGVRLKAPGQPVTARLLEPVYAGEVLAIPAGATIKGHVSAISNAPLHKRVGRLLDGDFTPPKTAQVTFDQLILSDGTTVQIHSDSAVGIGAVA